MKTDYLIIGSGVAGLSLALKLAHYYPTRQVTVVTKSEKDESNTKYAQGGVAVVIDEIRDSYQKHIQDTLIAGDGLCDKDVVEMVITQGPHSFKELLDWGAKFDKTENGNFDLGKEGGHSEYRVVHHKDQTGHEIERAIIKQVSHTKNIQFLDYFFALDLVVHNNRCHGVYAFDQKNNQVQTIQSGFTILATGGVGQLYGHSTNAKIATGDGIAMAYRINAEINDMEFIQFHPTAMFDKNTDETFLISEAVRGFGAFLRNKNGERFLLNYDPRAELASRDIVSQAIYKEMMQHGKKCVYLDCTHLDKHNFIHHFPMIYNHCIEKGIDPFKDWIPVSPTQHYLCGGIVVDMNGKTTVKNLFACGECTKTGLHGANRLASNSLLEAMVYSDRIFHTITRSSLNSMVTDYKIPPLQKKQDKAPDIDAIQKIKAQLQLLMRTHAGIVRNNFDLQKAHLKLLKWEKSVEKWYAESVINIELCEIRNMIETAKLIVVQSIQRDENKGGFFKTENTAVHH